MTTKPAHFEILIRRNKKLAIPSAFPTYEDALNELTADPFLSANANHPFYWGNKFEIVLCGGDGCTL